MDLSQIINATATSSSSQIQATGGHHHHHKSISDMIKEMNSAIDNAVKAGTMTSDQAASLKNELADVTKTLSQASNSSSTSQTSQSGSLSQLSDADRKKVFSELQDVRKQLFATLNPQNANTSSTPDAVSQLFSQIDTNGDGTVSKDEFTQFLAQIGANALGYNQNGNASSALTGSNFSITG
jgi:polyhydroxyalkanoate synthesis regulator phasin